MPSTRQKLVHQQGVIAKVEFVIDKRAKKKKKYTGLFKSGSDSALIRFSETGFHVDGLKSKLNPSIAIKFLRDGIESANQFGMISFDGIFDENDPWNWYAVDLSSHLPQFKEAENNDCINDEGE